MMKKWSKRRRSIIACSTFLQDANAGRRELMAAPTVGRRRHVPARIHADARPVVAGHVHRVRGARPVPDVGRVDAAAAAAAGSAAAVPAGPGGRGPGVAGAVQGGHRRRRARVQGPVDRYHQADRPVRGVRRAGLRVLRVRRRRRLAVRYHIRGHTNVPAARTGGRTHQTGADIDAGPRHTLADRRGRARQVAAFDCPAAVVRHQIRPFDR